MALLKAALGLALALAASHGQAYGFRDTANGVSCHLFDVSVLQPWPQGRMRWADAAGEVGGAKAYDAQVIEPRSSKQALRWNVTALVQAWGTGALPNDGMVLAGIGSGAGGVQVHSRESADVDRRPSLQVAYADGSQELLAAAADADLDCSGHTPRGAAASLNMDAKTFTLMRFDLAKLRKGRAEQIKKAELILVRTPISPWAAGAIGVFRLLTPYSEPAPAPLAGLAAAFAGDRGIDKHPDVLFADGFEAPKLDARWHIGSNEPPQRLETTGTANSPLGLQSLGSTVVKSKNTGLDLRYYLGKHHGQEPEELFLRYYLKVGREWALVGDNGKLPGLAATYNKVAWGGRGWDGQQGWSARGGFINAAPPEHPLRGKFGLGSYVYHAKAQQGGFGDIWAWGGPQGLAYVDTERWVCIEQQIKLNTPGREDGVLRAWVDGRLVFDRQDLRFRDTPALKIETAWLDVYYGGSKPSPMHFSFLIDNVVIAKRYIGPMPGGVGPQAAAGAKP